MSCIKHITYTYMEGEGGEERETEETYREKDRGRERERETLMDDRSVDMDFHPPPLPHLTPLCFLSTPPPILCWETIG